MRSDLSDEDLHFARQLKGRRLAANLSRQSLAKLTQRSEATIKFIEKGRTKPTVSTIAYLLQVAKLGLTIDDVPLLLREQVSDVLEPRASVREAAPSSDCLRPCSGGVMAAQLSTATLGTIAFLLQVPRLKLTLRDIPRRWRKQVSDSLELVPAAVCVDPPSPAGLRPCSDGQPRPPESPPSSPSSALPSADTTGPHASGSAQPAPA